jgi:hypothetical protein
MQQKEPGRGGPLGPRERAGLVSLAIAAHAGFSDQSQLCHHFKRLIGVTPRRFRKSARIASPSAGPAKKPQSAALTIPHERGRSAWPSRWRGAD